MPRDFYPRPERDIVKWTNNFSSRLIAEPQRYAVTEGQAAAYAERQATFAAAHRAARAKRAKSDTGVTVTKEMARVILEAETRKLVTQIRAAKGVSVDDKLKLGIRMLNGPKHRIKRPQTAPGIEILDVDGRTVRVRLVDFEEAVIGAKPKGVAGAVVLSYVGAQPPTDPADWRFERNTTKARFDFTFRGDVPAGETVWLTAYWYNPRRETGPACEAVCTNVRTGVVMEDEAAPLRLTPAAAEWTIKPIRKAA
jgi:hypothetical protein